MRQDAFAKANPLVVEEEKAPRLKGFYLHPELYGAPAEKQTVMGSPPALDEAVAGAKKANGGEADESCPSVNP